MEQLNSALLTLKHLRTNVAQIFETLGGGVQCDNNEDIENKFLHEIQELLSSANTNLRFEYLTFARIPC